jgi:exosortase K
MGIIREQEGVDFIIQSPPLTDEERKEISDFIQMRKQQKNAERNSARKSKSKTRKIAEKYNACRTHNRQFAVSRAETCGFGSFPPAQASASADRTTPANRPNAKPQTVGSRITETVQTNRNIPYYLTAAGLFILLKFGFTFADNDNLTFLLKPTDKLVGLLAGSHSVYLADKGFYHDKLNILIDKSCSGFNFWLLCFIVFTYLTVKYFDKPLHKILTIPTSLLGVYLLTIFVNTSRIFASVIVQTQTKIFFANQQYLIHEAVGIITNLTFLVLAYYLTEKLLIHRRHNAKLA